MISGVCIGTNNLDDAGKFYDPVLATIGMTRQVTTPHEIGYAAADGHVSFFVVTPFDEQAATFGNGTQIMFYAADKEAVHVFHETVLNQGGKNEGAPGPRDYSANYYGAYARDLDGNKLHVAIRTLE